MYISVHLGDGATNVQKFDEWKSAIAYEEFIKY